MRYSIAMRTMSRILESRKVELRDVREGFLELRPRLSLKDKQSSGWWGEGSGEEPDGVSKRLKSRPTWVLREFQFKEASP